MKKNDKNRIMPYTHFNERDSAYYKKMASLRKNPYKAFREDPELAKRASKLATIQRKAYYKALKEARRVAEQE